MVTEDCLNRVLPVVADSWKQLRRSDVDRLLNQIFYDDKSSLMVAAGIVAAKRPDLQKQIDQSVEWISEERGWSVIKPTTDPAQLRDIIANSDMDVLIVNRRYAEIRTTLANIGHEVDIQIVMAIVDQMASQDWYFVRLAQTVNK